MIEIPGERRAGSYFFGSEITKRPPSAADTRGTFVLGAYPSALHVRWDLPLGVVRDTGRRRLTWVNSLAVQDEPSPFWNGSDAHERVARWASSASPLWGKFTNDHSMNGSSGRLLDERYLSILGIKRGEAWITDCLDTYYGSKGQHAVVAFYRSLSDRAGPFPTVNLPSHPDTKTIERRAIEDVTQLRSELEMCEPEEVVTLGAAAFKVFLRLLEPLGSAPPGLTPVRGQYGRPVVVRQRGRTIRWWPLAHTASPKATERRTMPGSLTSSTGR